MKKWIIKGKELIFDEESHTYYYDGKKGISVTQVMQKRFNKKYDGIDPEILKRAAKKGSYYHQCVEMYEKYGIESEHQEFKNYLALKNKYKFEVIDCEKPIVFEYKGLLICGQTDLLIKEHKITGLADEKYTARCDEEYLEYQLNFYRLGIQQTYGIDIDFLRGIHLKNATSKYIMLPINEEICYELLEEIIGEENYDL